MTKEWKIIGSSAFVRRNLKSLKPDLSPLDIFPLVLQEKICVEKVLNFIFTNVLQHPRPRNLVLSALSRSSYRCSNSLEKIDGLRTCCNFTCVIFNLTFQGATEEKQRHRAARTGADV